MKKIKIFTLAIIGLIAVYIYTYQLSYDRLDIKNSSNHKAQSYFIHSVTIGLFNKTVMFKLLGQSIDSPLMKPTLTLQDYFFKKGMEYKNKDSAEDAMWWYYGYSNMYFTNRDYEKLSKKEQKRLFEYFYSSAMRLMDGNLADVKFPDKPENAIRNYIFFYIVGGYLSYGSFHDFISDRTIQENFKNLYNKFRKTFYVNNNDDEYLKALTSMLWIIIRGHDVVGDDVFFKCGNKYINEYLEILESSLAYYDNYDSEDKFNFIDSNFLRNKFMNKINNGCPDLKDKILELENSAKEKYYGK